MIRPGENRANGKGNGIPTAFESESVKHDSIAIVRKRKTNNAWVATYRELQPDKGAFTMRFRLLPTTA
jgi:hypothetical protein